MNLFFILLSSIETGGILSSDLVTDSYLYKFFGGLLIGLDSYISNLIPGVNAECPLVSPATECSSIAVESLSSQLNYTVDSSLEISLNVINDCTDLNQLLEKFTQTSFNCDSARMIFLDSISHTPHKNGLLKVNGFQGNQLNIEFVPSRTLMEDFQLSITLTGINYCYTLTGEECGDSCEIGCKNVISNREVAGIQQEVKFDLFHIESSVDSRTSYIFVPFAVLLIVFVLLIIAMFILKNRCRGFRVFSSREEKRRYLGGDLTADKPSLDNV